MSLQTHEPEPPLDEEPEPPVEEPEPEAEPEPEPEAMERIGNVAARVMQQPNPERALETRKDSLVQQAAALQVVDAASYEKAADLARTFAGMLDDAKAYWDPRVAKAHAPWKQACDDRAAFIGPLQAALDALKSRASSWFRTEEQKRETERIELERRAREAQETERKRLEAEAQKARAAGKTERARELKEEARQVEEAPPPPPPPSTVPKVKGISQRENWTFRITDKKAFIAGVAGSDQMLALVDTRLTALRDKEQSTEIDEAIYKALIEVREAMANITPATSIEAVEENAVYLRGRAKADKNTLRLPGVQIYNAGSVAVRA